MLSAVTQPNALHGSLFTVLIIWVEGVAAEYFRNASWMLHPSLGCRICTGEVQNPHEIQEEIQLLTFGSKNELISIFIRILTKQSPRRSITFIIL